MRTPRVAIIGAGVSGLCMGIKLREAGIETFTIYEKSDRVGGTWRENTYPGLYVDVMSRYYQYSFAPNPDWTRLFAPGPEICQYLDRVTDDYGLRPKIVSGAEITRAEWVDGRWELHSADGKLCEVDFIVTACGFLHHPVVPKIPGLETFAGPAFHSARWDHSVTLSDKRVAVIGSGSTGVQITTALAGTTAGVSQFMRTPQWVLAVPNPRYSRLTKWVLRRVPALSRLAYRGYQALAEWLYVEGLVHDGWQRRLISAGCRLSLRTVKDPGLREQLTPGYEPACKRLVWSGGYYRAVQRHRVQIVRESIVGVEPDAIITADGTRHPIDVVVLATGFDSHALVRPIEFVGPGGHTLSDAWRNGPRGYGTIAVPGLPNLFMTMGPRTPVNVSSLFNVAESQVGYVMSMIEKWRRGEIDALTASDSAADRFEREAAASFTGTIWVTGCDSWYLGQDGTPEFWPWMPSRHRAFLAEPDLADYEAVPTRDESPTHAIG